MPKLVAVWLAIGSLASAQELPAAPAADEGEGVTPDDQLDELLEATEAPPQQPSEAHPFALEDLAPYFDSGKRLEAKHRFDRGQFALARRLLSKEGDAPAVRYLRAMSAFLARDFRTANAELTALAPDYPPLKDSCLLYAGLSAEAMRKPGLAAQAFAQVPSGTSAFPEARFGLSRALAKQLDLPGAVEALEPLRQLPATRRNEAVRARALNAVAKLEQLRGDWAEEHRALLEVWATSPRSPQAEAAWERLKRTTVPNKWRVRRAAWFLATNENAEAMKLAAQIKAAVPDPDACTAKLVEGNALRKERHHRRTIEVLGPVVAQCRATDVRPQAMYLLGYSQSVVDPRSAVGTYDALVHDYPDHGYADDSLFFAGELAARLGDEAGALARFEQVASRYPTGSFAAEALFRAAWIHRARGRIADARVALERVPRLPGVSDEDVLRARYWNARALAAQGDAAATPMLAQLAIKHPASWYGLLARGAARSSPALEGSPATAGDVSWPIDAGPVASDRHFMAGIELLRLGLPSAADELMAIDRSGLPAGAARIVIEALRGTGRFEAADSLSRATLSSEIGNGMAHPTRDVWEASFPRPFRDEVEKRAADSGVDPDLLQALMREESRFYPYARSSTGALGLTQLMPGTARRVARDLKLGHITRGSLYRPGLNIQLGAAYLGRLLSDFGGRAAFAVAAYNAGPEAVNAWIRAASNRSLDEWVEEIPVAETRDYVKRVLSSYGAYRLVYDPEHLLTLESMGHAEELHGASASSK